MGVGAETADIGSGSSKLKSSRLGKLGASVAGAKEKLGFWMGICIAGCIIGTVGC